MPKVSLPVSTDPEGRGGANNRDRRHEVIAERWQPSYPDGQEVARKVRDRRGPSTGGGGAKARGGGPGKQAGLRTPPQTLTDRPRQPAPPNPARRTSPPPGRSSAAPPP